ncbi:MAG: hypothetical protein A2157_14400 [Deltaproteobacteria bacterium RBG_16_47_11]|nr:MAG: hypothetical protein A2157_14400 [Deltaproteobacteria bacterium RBG_16_47_11]
MALLFLLSKFRWAIVNLEIYGESKIRTWKRRRIEGILRPTSLVSLLSILFNPFIKTTTSI